MRIAGPAWLAIPAAGLLTLALAALPGHAQHQQRCDLVDDSIETVTDGVTLTYGSSFRCENAPDSEEYVITVAVSNHTGGAEAVTVRQGRLSHTSPRPRGRSPSATVNQTGLPVTAEPSRTTKFDIRGSYQLVRTDEGKKANLHIRANGAGETSGQQFTLGINIHLRGPGVTEGEGQHHATRRTAPRCTARHSISFHGALYATLTSASTLPLLTGDAPRRGSRVTVRGPAAPMRG